MTEFVEVIRSSGLNGEPVEAQCPRELLGLACINAEYACLCELVEGCSVEMVRQGGMAPVLNLSMKLRQGIDAQTVMTGIDLTGLRADFKVSREAVTASFNMRRPQNTELIKFVRETGV
ncbi:hypothetical protein [Nocardioides sp.]|uniref:hypothetical protein n=1 Tax=Nocardioides sp. TaxID=35761 RepID=UPI003782E36D